MAPIPLKAKDSSVFNTSSDGMASYHQSQCLGILGSCDDLGPLRSEDGTGLYNASGSEWKLRHLCVNQTAFQHPRQAQRNLASQSYLHTYASRAEQHNPLGVVDGRKSASLD